MLHFGVLSQMMHAANQDCPPGLGGQRAVSEMMQKKSVTWAPKCTSHTGRGGLPSVASGGKLRPIRSLTSPAVLARAMRSRLGDQTRKTTSCGSCFSPTTRKDGKQVGKRNIGADGDGWGRPRPESQRASEETGQRSEAPARLCSGHGTSGSGFSREN